MKVGNLKNWNKRKRAYLGFSLDIKNYNGGLDFIREIVRKRDNDTCQKCLVKWIRGTRKLDVHHLDEKMEGKRDIKYDRKNTNKMITLCHKCHLNLPHLKVKFKKSYRLPQNFIYKRIAKECLNCKKMFSFPPSQMEKRKHCSDKCFKEKMLKSIGLTPYF